MAPPDALALAPAQLPLLALGARIPRLIHQTFPSHALPAPLAEHVAALRARNPGWAWRLYDDADIARYILTHYDASIWQRYERLDARYGPARADLFRYLLVYREGGVYLDVKSTALRPLDEVLRDDDQFILSQWDNAPGASEPGFGCHRALAHVPGGEFQQWHLMAAPGHPFVRAVIVEVLRRIDRYHPLTVGVGKPGVLRTTGPLAYTLAIAPIRAHHPHRFVNGRVELGLRYNVLGEARGARPHAGLFSAHYSTLWQPLVRRRYRCWPLLRLVLRGIGALRRCNQQRLAARRSRHAVDSGPSNPPSAS